MMMKTVSLAVSALCLVLPMTRDGGVVVALNTDGPAWTRRQVAKASSAAALGWLVGGGVSGANDETTTPAASPPSLVVPRNQAVMVLGANGQTGQECVKYVLSQQPGRPCLATSRSGVYNGMDDLPTKQQASLTSMVADVSSYDSLERAVLKSSQAVGAMIFCASTGASKDKAADPFAVDRDGVVYAAQCCLAHQIPRLVVVSSGTVTRPDSAVYKLLNFVGKGIMEAKIQGEDAMRQLYATSNVAQQKSLGYTVIRPGGLTTGVALGASAMELNQGDNKSGRLSRADVAALCLESLDSPDTFDTTFECYESSTAKPVESVGLSNILKKTDGTTFVSGKERRGDTYASLFKGLERDV